jgi:hypothetical protein
MTKGAIDMRRINAVLGLAVMAVLTLSAFAVSAASAAAPELIRAGKPGEVVKGEIKGKSEGNTVLETENGTTVACETAEVKSGKAASTKELTGKFAFKGCKESLFGVKCNTKGKAGGEIETGETTGLIGFRPGSKEAEVDLELRPTGTKESLETPLVTFECTGGFAKVEVRGAVIGMLGEGELKKSTKTLKVLYEKGSKAGTQELTEMTGGFMKEAKLESNLNDGKFERANHQGIGKLEFAEAVELT